MHDHEIDGTVAAPRTRPAPESASELGPEVTRAVAAGRPDTLGSANMLHLQRVAGNAGVQALVVQRREAEGKGAEDGADAESPVHSVVATPGSPLDTATRASMEGALGADFGDVQVHTDPAASASAASVQAHAYTVGNHVVFGEGRYQPGTDDGRRTLAHELTHVVQQRQGPVEGTPAPGGIRVSDPSDHHEREASAAADRVMAGGAPAAGPVAAAAVQREEDDGPAPAAVQRQGDEEQEEAPPTEAPPEEKEEEMGVSKLDVQREAGEEEAEEQE
jgi:hypothetical protein